MKRIFCALVIVGVLGVALVACTPLTADPPEFRNPGDLLGGGTEGTAPSARTSALPDRARAAAQAVSASAMPANVQEATAQITRAGDYAVRGEWAQKIHVTTSGVHLWFVDAHVRTDAKAVESDADLTITLLGENALENQAKNAVDCVGDLTINGSGSLSVTAAKHAIKANSIAVVDATLVLDAQSDALHAEIDAYDADDVRTPPDADYAAGGWVYVSGAHLQITAGDDGVSADTFVFLQNAEGQITTNGGAPDVVTEASSDAADGKGIKAGAIDYGPQDEEGEREEVEQGDYLVLIEGGNWSINANDDALHSNGELHVLSGTLAIASGDDALHAETLNCVNGGTITVSRCYEGIEGAKVQISGGEISVNSTDDGLNAADGSSNRPGTANSNCHLIISGGSVQIKAGGDGVDSNGSILLTGGTLLVSGPQRADNAALDADGAILVNGGRLFACGPIGMVQTPASNSAQCVLSFAHSQTIAAGTQLNLTTADGEVLFAYTPQSACRSVILSCPELQQGESYQLWGGDAVLTQFTPTGVITQLGSSAGLGMPGTRPGGGMGR